MGMRTFKICMKRANSLPWEPTGFFVVGELTRNGKIRGVYVIYDMFPRNERGERTQVKSGNWACLPGTETQITCARLANNMGHFTGGFQTWLQWTPITTYPIEIVRLVNTNNQIRRVTVSGHRIWGPRTGVIAKGGPFDSMQIELHIRSNTNGINSIMKCIWWCLWALKSNWNEVKPNIYSFIIQIQWDYTCSYIRHNAFAPRKVSYTRIFSTPNCLSTLMT